MPLHYGKAPAWLFKRMSALAREITWLMVTELGQDAFLKKLSDPYWFQSLGCVLGFDWHSSGLTTTVTGALKEGLKGMERELGVFMAGGKGAASRKTPDEIKSYGDRHFIEADPASLIYSSRMSAKVDNTAVQDGYQLYHHVMVFTSKGDWAVVQQGMNNENRMARRYHWLGSAVKSFVEEPHAAVCCDKRQSALNMVAVESEEARGASAVLAREKPEALLREIRKLDELEMAKRHNVTFADVSLKRLSRVFLKTYEKQPVDFEHLLGIEGVGPKTIRALSLVSEIIYGKKPSYRDPARFSFAVGGKDGTPYPVDKRVYDETTQIMGKAINAAKISNREKLDAIKRLAGFYDS